MPLMVPSTKAPLTIAKTIIDLQDQEQELETDPVVYVQDGLKEKMWSKQRAVLEAVAEHRRVAVHSCHNTGKSHTAARAAVWWIKSHPMGKALVVTTATTNRQVKLILWRYIKEVHHKGRLPGKCITMEWKIGGVVVAVGMKPADWDPYAFEGLHNLYVLVIIDEACGVPETIWDAAETLASNDFSHILAIGNPDDPTSRFARVCKPGSGWFPIGVSAFESPNFPDALEEDKALRDELGAYLISPAWAEERKQKWGERSPIYVSKVLGQFPESAEDGVIPLSWLMKCCEERDYPASDLSPVELGMDVGAGGDPTVIWERRGRRVGRVWRSYSPNSPEVVDLAIQAIHESGATSIKVDAIGIGWGIAGALEEAYENRRHRAIVHQVNVAVAAPDPTRFPLLRDQIWFDIGRGLSEDCVWDFSGMEEDDRDTMLAQLIAPKYKRFSGRIKVEPKEETKKTLGRSPDDADALLLAYYVPPREIPEGVFVPDDQMKQISPI